MGTGLVKPLFDSIHMLIDDAVDQEDFQCVGQILVRSGTLLSELNPEECDKLVIKTRKALCFHDKKLDGYTRFIMLNVSQINSFKK